MANIDKQMIARMPMTKFTEFTLDYSQDWNIPVKKIWNKTEKDRHTFRFSNNEGLLECGPKLAEELSFIVNDMFEAAGIDKEKVGEIKVIITKSENCKNGFCIHVDTKNLPKKRKMERVWASITSIFRKK